MFADALRKRTTRGLRFRLTASYALFFTLLTGATSILYRQFLSSSLAQQSQDSLEQEWAALKGYLRIEKGNVIWLVDDQDTEEADIKARLQRVYFLADSKGSYMNASEKYRELGLDPPAAIRTALRSQQPVWHEKRDGQGVPYLIRAGRIKDENWPAYYYVAIGRSLEDNRQVLRKFTLLSAGVVPLVILGGCIMGWVLAGNSLTPVLAVAKAAQRISGSNLSLRIPTRGAADELDYLIETFNQMIERLETSFRQIRQFSTDVSHELRTPITIIRGQLEVALFTAETKEQYRDAIVDSLQDIERLSQIVRALLLLSQAETGQVILQRAPLDFVEVIHDIVDQFQIPADGAHVKLSCSTPPSCPANLDRVQIERMLSNLLSNAIKFTPPGGAVSVELTGEGEQARLVISDTGCGIDTRHLPHIFDRFFRVEGADASATPEKGLGLGLSFVAWIVKAHDGEITVDSTPGAGTRFTITLPLQSAAIPPASREEVPAMKKV